MGLSWFRGSRRLRLTPPRVRRYHPKLRVPTRRGRARAVTSTQLRARHSIIARAHGIDAVGYAAGDAAIAAWQAKVRLREILARTAAVGDVFVWFRGPRFLGPQETVGLASVTEPRL